MFEVKSKIPKVDRDIFRDFDTYSEVEAHKYIRSVMPQNKKSHLVKLLDVVDRKAYLPEGFDAIVNIGGVDFSDLKKRAIPQYRTEVVGFMRKATDFCDYVVTNDCSCSDVERCDHAIRLEAQNYLPSLGVGQDYLLLMHNYGSIKDGDKHKMFYHPDFFVMHPKRSSFFGAKSIPDCINLGLGKYSGSKYEFSMDGDEVTTNFEKGKILLSYEGFVYDNLGYVKFPDTPGFVDAIVAKVVHEVYEHLLRVTHDQAYERIANRSKTNFTEKHLIAEADLLKIPFEELVMAIGEHKWKHNIVRDYLSAMENSYHPDVTLTIQNYFKY
jgi:hypothetical protein